MQRSYINLTLIYILRRGTLQSYAILSCIQSITYIVFTNVHRLHMRVFFLSSHFRSFLYVYVFDLSTDAIFRARPVC